MPYQPFTFGEVETIFRLSEGATPNIGSGGIGHAGARHVDISNSGLNTRLSNHSSGGLAAYSAFLTFRDQVNAALQILNLPENDPPLERFRQEVRPGKPFSIEQSWLPTPMVMRYATPGGAATFPCHYFTLFLRKDMSRPRDMHVVSFFGTMGPMA
jgi:hypothetical protein